MSQHAILFPTKHAILKILEYLGRIRINCIVTTMIWNFLCLSTTKISVSMTVQPHMMELKVHEVNLTAVSSQVVFHIVREQRNDIIKICKRLVHFRRT